MLTIEIKRTYSDRSVTRGILTVDDTPIGVTMEAPRRPGMMGKCLLPGEYSAKLVCTEYSPFTVKIISYNTLAVTQIYINNIIAGKHRACPSFGI